MRECLVNDAPVAVDFRPETWGELLEQLDRSLGLDRRVVTAVRFDGVDEPSFRAAAQTGRALGPVSRVDVSAVEASRLLEDALGAAADSLPALAAGARLTAAAYRAGAPDAHGQLTALIGAIQSLVALTTAAATAARAAGGGTPSGGAVAASCGAAETALVALIDRHTRADWPALADALDGELAPSILDWQHVLGAIRQEATA
jgi:hypothetical protein